MKILDNSKVVVLICLLLGMLLPSVATRMKLLLLPFLVLTMTFSLKDVHLGHITKKNFRFIIKLVGMNFIFYSGLLIVLAFIFIKNPHHRNGFILLAAMPPAIGVIPLSYILKTDIKTSILTELTAYVVSILYSPLLIWFFFSKTVNIWFFIQIFLSMLILPMILAQLLTRLKVDMRHHYTHRIVNLAYGLSFFIIVGMNLGELKRNPGALVPILLVSIMVTFVAGLMVFIAVKNRKRKTQFDILYVLFGTFKNGGLVAAIAILMFNSQTTVPIVIKGIIVPFYIFFIEILIDRYKKHYEHHLEGKIVANV
jgi:BASS family bile acid:Na+ symporter